MSDQGPFARVYYSVIDDARFEGVYDDDHHFATWVRLLIAADAKWPASPDLPTTCRKASVAFLADRGIVELRSHSRYRIHGLDAERNRRTDAARNAAAVRWQSESNAPAMPRARTASRAEPSKAKPADARDSLDRYHELTNFQPWGQWSGDALTRLESDFGRDVTVAAVDAEYAANPDRNTLLKRIGARLARDAEHAKRDTPKRPKLVKPPEDREAINAEIRRLMATPQETV